MSSLASSRWMGRSHWYDPKFAVKQAIFAGLTEVDWVEMQTASQRKVNGYLPNDVKDLRHGELFVCDTMILQSISTLPFLVCSSCINKIYHLQAYRENSEWRKGTLALVVYVVHTIGPDCDNMNLFFFLLF